MFVWYPIHNQHKSLQIWASQMRRNSLRIAPVSPTQAISSIQRHQKSLYDILLNTHTGHPLKWFRPALKSQPPEISQDRSYAIDHSPSKSSVSDMLTLLKTSRSYCEKHDFKTQRTDKTVSKRAIKSYRENGNLDKTMLSAKPEWPTNGLSIMA